ncbi:MAG: HEAT repeat domain-containing protein [Elusimicrobia bacterium]|nr:HEAT repeat domain-containing protein [Elusimicrobiota bacterium]
MLDLLTGSPRFYEYVTYGVLFLAAFNLAEIVFLLYNKRRVERSERRKTELKRLASTALITATKPEELLPPPSNEEEFAAYSEAIASVLDSFEGEIAEKAAGLVDALGIGEYYRRLARHRTWYKRGNAVDILSSFRLASNREFFRAAFRSEPVTEVKYRMIYGLSGLARDHEDILETARMLSSLPYLTSKYTEDVFYNAIGALRSLGAEEEFGVFMSGLLKDGSVPALVKRDVLTACYAAACEKGRGLLHDYYRNCQREPEILIAALKALARIGDFTFVPEALRHPDWRVRMTALKKADLCCADMLPEIRALLRDPNYHVRLAAALALRGAGGKGLAALKEESASQDRFAAETAAYVLSQEGL